MASMTFEERSDLVLAFARVLYVNGQSTDDTLTAAERLSNSLDLHSEIIPRWGELQIATTDGSSKLVLLAPATPADLNSNNRIFTAGLRFNEPLPVRLHNTMSLGYVQNRLSQHFVPPGARHLTGSTELNSTPCWKSNPWLCCSRLFNITQTWVEGCNALWYLDSERN
jgi:hypothetical protein